MRDRDTQNGAEMLPIGDVARALGVSVETIRRWDRDGQIKSTRTPGGQRRFTRAEVERVKAGAAA